MNRISTVVALYVDPRGPYPLLLEHWYDAEKDARRYAGDLPVVAHPPCGPWGRLKHLSKQEEERPFFGHALDLVRRNGGVLEHPAYSRAFFAHGLPRPDKQPDAFGGFTIRVNQVDFGHVARKPTWLYIVGKTTIPPLPPPREPTHWVSGWRNAKGPRGKAPPGIKICSAVQRNRTPIDFARFLIEIAQKENT